MGKKLFYIYDRGEINSFIHLAKEIASYLYLTNCVIRENKNMQTFETEHWG